MITYPDDEWPREYWARRRAMYQHRLETMTLGEAASWLAPENRFACACHGGPPCCMDISDVALRLQRAGHIALKQIAELAEMGSR